MTRAIQKAVGEAEGHHVQALKGAHRRRPEEDGRARARAADGGQDVSHGNGTPHVLFVYYSFTQQTRRVADTMADTLRGRGYDVTEAAIEFTDAHYGKRFSKRPMSWPIAKIFSMLPAQVRRKTGEIGIPPAASGGDYDLVVIGSPTWWLTTCMPVRSLPARSRGRTRARGQALRGVLHVSSLLQEQPEDDPRARGRRAAGSSSTTRTSWPTATR